MAGGIIARLKAAGLAGEVPVTGQDASVEGLQNILLGYQCMTVYKDTDLEANAASRAGDRADQGRQDAAAALATGAVRTPSTGEDVPSALATPEAVYRDNVPGGHRRRLPDRRPTSARASSPRLCAEHGIS